MLFGIFDYFRKNDLDKNQEAVLFRFVRPPFLLTTEGCFHVTPMSPSSNRTQTQTGALPRRIQCCTSSRILRMSQKIHRCGVSLFVIDGRVMVSDIQRIHQNGVQRSETCKTRILQLPKNSFMTSAKWLRHV